MFKIAICIFVAVCINFQQVVVAASLPNPLESFGSFGLDFGSLLNNAQGKISESKDQVSNIFDGIINHGKDTVQKIGSDVIDLGEAINSQLSTEVQKLKNKTEQLQTDAQNTNSSACVRLYNNALASVINIPKSCLWDKTAAIVKDLESFVNAITIILQKVSMKMQDMVQYLKNRDYNNFISLIVEILSGLPTLISKFRLLSRRLDNSLHFTRV